MRQHFEWCAGRARQKAVDWGFGRSAKFHGRVPDNRLAHHAVRGGRSCIAQSLRHLKHHLFHLHLWHLLCGRHSQLHNWEHSLCSQRVCEGEDIRRCSSIFLAPCILRRHPKVEGWLTLTVRPFDMAGVAGVTYDACHWLDKEGLQGNEACTMLQSSTPAATSFRLVKLHYVAGGCFWAHMRQFLLR